MLIGRSSSFPIKKGSLNTRQFAHTAGIEVNRSEVPGGDSFARQCGPVGNPKDDEEWSDALFVITVRQQSSRIEVRGG